MPPPTILIIGSSIAGPALACFLLLSPVTASQKPHITILERASVLRTQGQNIDIRGAGIAIIRKLGLESEIRRNLTNEKGVRWVDSRDRVKAQIDASPGGPTAELEIMRGRLAEILVQRVQSISDSVQQAGGRGVEWLFGDWADTIEQDTDGVRVKLSKNGNVRSFDLVVAADGLHSQTRKLLWGAQGEEQRVHNLGISAGFFSMPVAETDGAYRRWYHAPGRRGAMIRPDQVSNRTSCMVHVMNPMDKRFTDFAVGRSAEQEQKALLDEYMKDAGWESKRIVKQMWATDDFYYDMFAQVKMINWSIGRVVLLGDAAYCASPISGMGTTLALNGAYHLAGYLSQDAQDYDTAFSKYEAKMSPIVAMAHRLAPAKLNLLFGIDTWWGIWMINTLAGLLTWFALPFKLVFLYLGPPAEQIVVEDFLFEHCVEE